ncbi:MAG: hypothetical protein FWD41_02435 [Actinomycetia bacterium]|nr:hypothetical protein [Actinomycetes bacterium]
MKKKDRTRTESTTTRVLKWLAFFCLGIIAAYLVIVAALLYSVYYGPDQSSTSNQVTQTENSEEAESEVTFDVSSWSNEELAAQMLIIMAPSNDTAGFYILAHYGVGAITLSGGKPVPETPRELAAAQAEVARGIPMLVCSDEEGGEVAHLADLVGALPAPADIIELEYDEITAMTRAHGEKLAAIGVHAVLAPTLDLAEPDTYMTRLGRSFGADPAEVTDYGRAWIEGMHEAGLAVTLKHWPGIGSAPDTHAYSNAVHALDVMEQRDMVPFDTLIGEGAEMVMLGHVMVPGLTEPDTAVSLSPAAYAYLREHSGPDLIIMTDCLSMAGAIKGQNLSIAQAAVRSIAAGADLVMAGAMDTADVIDELSSAIDTGIIDRSQAELSVQKLLRLKASKGLIE